jgi:hypothetical protein
MVAVFLHAQKNGLLWETWRLAGNVPQWRGREEQTVNVKSEGVMQKMNR